MTQDSPVDQPYPPSWPPTARAPTPRACHSKPKRRSIARGRESSVFANNPALLEHRTHNMFLTRELEHHHGEYHTPFIQSSTELTTPTSIRQLGKFQTTTKGSRHMLVLQTQRKVWRAHFANKHSRTAASPKFECLSQNSAWLP